MLGLATSVRPDIVSDEILIVKDKCFSNNLVIYPVGATIMDKDV